MMNLDRDEFHDWTGDEPLERLQELDSANGLLVWSHGGEWTEEDVTERERLLLPDWSAATRPPSCR
jgi:hypothetical protein